VKGLESLLDHDEVLILLADQPSIDIDYLNDLISGLQENNKTIIASKYGDIYGVPAIFPSHYFPELLKLKGDQGAKQLLNSGTILVKSINSSVNLFDVDTPEDYQKLIQDQ
jgi:molybdenum cofactor cytidylyltransferase